MGVVFGCVHVLLGLVTSLTHMLCPPDSMIVELRLHATVGVAVAGQLPHMGMRAEHGNPTARSGLDTLATYPVARDEALDGYMLYVSQTQALPAVRLSAQESLRALWCLTRSLGPAEIRFASFLKLSLARGVEIAIATISISVPWMLHL